MKQMITRQRDASQCSKRIVMWNLRAPRFSFWQSGAQAVSFLEAANHSGVRLHDLRCRNRTEISPILL